MGIAKSLSGGFVPVDELVTAIADADAGVVAMRRDAFRDVTLAGKMFDFIAMRRPVLSSRTRSVEETFDPSCVELFESGDAADLARAIRALHADPARRTAMVARAAEVAREMQWSRQRADPSECWPRVTASGGCAGPWMAMASTICRRTRRKRKRR